MDGRTRGTTVDRGTRSGVRRTGTCQRRRQAAQDRLGRWETAIDRAVDGPHPCGASGRAEYRNTVKRKLHAYHVFIQTGLICQGLLQYLSVAHPRLVWASFGSWLRTVRPGIPPSELVVATALRQRLPELLLDPRKTTSSQNSPPKEPIPIKCRASNSQLERKFWANPRLSSLVILPLKDPYLSTQVAFVRNQTKPVLLFSCI